MAFTIAGYQFLGPFGLCADPSPGLIAVVELTARNDIDLIEVLESPEIVADYLRLAPTMQQRPRRRGIPMLAALPLWSATERREALDRLRPHLVRWL